MFKLENIRLSSILYGSIRICYTVPHLLKIQGVHRVVVLNNKNLQGRNLARESREIPVFFIAGHDVAGQMSVAMISILANTRANVRFFVLEGDDDPFDKRDKQRILKIKRDFPNFDVEYIYIDGKVYAGMNPSKSGYIPNSTYFRYAIPEIKKEIEKAIYLDIDVVFNGDIVDLYDIDIGDNFIAAVKHPDECYIPGSFFINVVNNLHTFGLRNIKEYVNCGVLIVNCKKWRDCKSTIKLIDKTYCLGGKIKWADQDILNLVFDGGIKFLDGKYNFLATLYKEKTPIIGDIYILHFNGAEKALFCNFVLGEFFWNYASKSPFFRGDVRSIDLIPSICGYKSKQKREIDSIYNCFLFFEKAYKAALDSGIYSKKAIDYAFNIKFKEYYNYYKSYDVSAKLLELDDTFSSNLDHQKRERISYLVEKYSKILNEKSRPFFWRIRVFEKIKNGPCSKTKLFGIVIFRRKLLANSKKHYIFNFIPVFEKMKTLTCSKTKLFGIVIFRRKLLANSKKHYIFNFIPVFEKIEIGGNFTFKLFGITLLSIRTTFASVSTFYLFNFIPFWSVGRSLGGAAKYFLFTCIQVFSKRPKFIEYKKMEKIKIYFLFHSHAFWPSWESFWNACKNDPRVYAKMIFCPAAKLGNGYEGQFIGAEKWLKDNGIDYTHINDIDFDKVHPHILIIQTPYDGHRKEKYRVKELARRGIRCVYISYGLEFTEEPERIKSHFSLQIHADAWRIYTFIPMLVADYGKYCPVGNSHVRCLGHPKFDGLYDLTQYEIPSKIRAKANSRKIVVWHTHFPNKIYINGEVGYSTFDWTNNIKILDYIGSRKDLFFVFIPHHLFFGVFENDCHIPHEDIEAFKSRLENGENSTIWYDDYRPILACGDIFMAERSAVTMEMITTGKPVIYLEQHPEIYNEFGKAIINSYYYATVAAEAISSLEDIEKGNEPKKDLREETLKEQIQYFDGKAGDRIKDDIVQSIMDESK